MTSLAASPPSGPRPLPPKTKPSLASGSSLDEQYAEGKSLREKWPRKSHGQWKAPDGRPDPVSLMEQSNQGRIPELVPIRHGRMLKSPFTFYRGAALNMAADLAGTPATGLRVQVCGDCHLSNFGAFATPERRVIFDINDLDETLPAPWEWDVKRLAASFILACRSNGFSEDTARDTVLACVRSYRERMREFRKMRVLDLWYARIDVEEMIEDIRDKEGRTRMQKRLAQARARSVVEHDFPKLADVAGQRPIIKDSPPLIFHWHKGAQERFFAEAKASFAEYRATLQEDRQHLLDHYELRDVAMKVVGVGSVGTWCGIMLLLASEQDLLFLQVKEARASVLEAYAGRSIYRNHDQRVVNGCRLMQSASDLLLGWVQGPEDRHVYVRQLRDMKISVLVEAFNRWFLRQYAEVCGWTLARAHARSGEPAKIAGYLGKSDQFDEAIADFAAAYADQAERDHKVFRKAVRDGRLEAETVKEG
jgi:uncharacterized protein (DUF2252 family)